MNQTTDLNSLFPRDEYRKPYALIDCPNFHELNQGILDYARKYTRLFVDDPREPGFYESGRRVQYCNFVDLKHFVKENKGVFDFFKEKKAIIADVYYTLCWERQYIIPLHVDKPPVTWKINWPVFNMSTSVVRFWKYRDPTVNLNELIVRTGDPCSKDHDNYPLPEDALEITYEHQFNDIPVVMNGLVPHDVALLDHAEFPRIGIQFMFRDIPYTLVPKELL